MESSSGRTDMQSYGVKRTSRHSLFGEALLWLADGREVARIRRAIDRYTGRCVRLIDEVHWAHAWNVTLYPNDWTECFFP